MEGNVEAKAAGYADTPRLDRRLREVRMVPIFVKTL